MKRNWEYKKLGDVCTIVGRIGFRGYKRSDYVEGLNDGAISLSPSNINNGVLDYSKCTFISWEKYKESPEIMIENGDVLLVKTASVGKSAYVEHLPHETTINPQFVVLKHISANHKYIAYVVKSNSFLLDLKSITFGSSVPTLSQKDLADLSIPVPPLEEQSRIVAELDLLTGIIDKQNAQLKELDNLAQAIFYDMFGDPIENPKRWEVKKLSDVCSLITDGVHAKPVYVEQGVPFVSVKDITTGKLIFDDVKYVSASDHATMFKRCPVANGDILYTKVGATYGRPALVDTDKEFSLYVSVALLKPRQDVVNNVFLCHQMATDFVKHQADKSIKGIGVPDLHLNMIRNFHILVPPKSLQLEFNSRIVYVEKQKETIRASIADTQKLLDYTMDKYFG